MSANSPAYPPYERMRTGLCLAAVGGFLEAYTYTLKGGVFANAQTGNLVLFALRLTQAQWGAALEAAAPIAAFFLGILLTERLKRLPARRGLFQWHCIAVCGECALLFCVAWFPASLPDFATTLAVSFVCSIQYDSFQKTHGRPFATTFCTGNLRSTGMQLARCLYDHDKSARHAARRYVEVIGVFLLGAVTGGLCSRQFGQPAVLVCCALLLAVLAAFLVEAKHDAKSPAGPAAK